jgi:hypothetical protein
MVAALHACTCATGTSIGEENGKSEALKIFQRRVLPIVNSPDPSSCTECHFGGVELRNYIRDDHAATFAALRDDGWIDVQTPDKSKLIEFIKRKPEQENPLLARVRQKEYVAIRDWIRAAVKEPELLTSEAGDIKVGSELPPEVIRHMRRDRVLASFVENIWLEIGRCINCHEPSRNERIVREHGDQVSWIHQSDPAATLEKCIDQGLIDIDEPDKSMLLLKAVALEVDHGGGPKFAVGSRTDKNYRRFLTDFAAVSQGKYRRRSQLPSVDPEVAALTEQHLRIVGLPTKYDKMLLKVDIYRWEGNAWSSRRVATADNPVNGERHMWQSLVLAVAPRGSAQADELHRHAQLPAGRYLVKIYVDAENATQQDADYVLGERNFVGQVETRGTWKPGYQPPKIIHAPHTSN